MEIKLPDFKTKRNPGDYEQDGLLYCGKCKTAKQTRVNLLGTVRTVPCMCTCEQEQYEQEKAERRERERLMAIDRARHEAFQDGRMIGWTFEQDDGANARLSKTARKYAENFNHFLSSGRGLLLYGNTGTGKTFAACCVANKLIDDGYSVLVKNFSTIANELLSTWDKDEYMEDLNGVSLLVLDDLDIERKSEYMQETVYSVIDSRYRSRRPLIVTTNLTLQQIQNPPDTAHARIYDRLLEMCAPVRFTGGNFRRETAQAKLERLKNLMNE